MKTALIQIITGPKPEPSGSGFFYSLGRETSLIPFDPVNT